MRIFITHPKLFLSLWLWRPLRLRRDLNLLITPSETKFDPHLRTIPGKPDVVSVHILELEQGKFFIVDVMSLEILSFDSFLDGETTKSGVIFSRFPVI